MSTEALRKAVERICSSERYSTAWPTTDGMRILARDWEVVRRALRDQESALATRRDNYNALVIRLGEVTARLEAAEPIAWAWQCDGMKGWALGNLEPTPENTHAFHERNTVVRRLYFIDTHLKAPTHV